MRPSSSNLARCLFTILHAEVFQLVVNSVAGGAGKRGEFCLYGQHDCLANRCQSIAAADVDVKLADRHARDRQLFLILVDDTGLHHRPGTVGTMRGERRVVALIHARGTSPTRLGSIRAAGLPPWSLRMRLQRFSNGAACRKPARRASSTCRFR